MKPDGVASVCMAMLDSDGIGYPENEARESHSVKIVVGLLLQPLRRPNPDFDGFFKNVGPQVSNQHCLKRNQPFILLFFMRETSFLVTSYFYVLYFLASIQLLNLLHIKPAGDASEGRFASVVVEFLLACSKEVKMDLCSHAIRRIVEPLCEPLLRCNLPSSSVKDGTIRSIRFISDTAPVLSFRPPTAEELTVCLER
jgi:hypothetical protein